MIERATTRGTMLAIVLATFTLAPAVQAAPLAEFPPTQWGCDLGNKKVMQGISAALLSREWRIVENDKRGNIVAEIIVRNKHTLVIDIIYTDTTYEVRYKSSENLKYSVRDDGAAQIHGNANKWMRNLHKDIGLQLSVLCSLQ